MCALPFGLMRKPNSEATTNLPTSPGHTGRCRHGSEHGSEHGHHQRETPTVNEWGTAAAPLSPPTFRTRLRYVHAPAVRVAVGPGPRLAACALRSSEGGGSAVSPATPRPPRASALPRVRCSSANLYRGWRQRGAAQHSAVALSRAAPMHGARKRFRRLWHPFRPLLAVRMFTADPGSRLMPLRRAAVRFGPRGAAASLGTVPK